MKKLLLVLILLVSSSAICAQSGIRIGLSQDLRLATVGDNRGNDAFTPALLFRFDMQGNQFEWGYMVIGFEVEYADLRDFNQTLYNGEVVEVENSYKRYSVNLGYTFNRLIVRDLEATAMINYGMIDRWGGAFLGFSSSGRLSYPIGESGLRVNAIGQLTDRRDLEWAYGTGGFKFSGLVGLSFDISVMGSKHRNKYKYR